ncbi:hypothetical protein HY492_00805 [Candidatus Woesearchaeota archaeon]|nr:hypothetical protein [Candidatus Woesearchaeota archaeon]
MDRKEKHVVRKALEEITQLSEQADEQSKKACELIHQDFFSYVRQYFTNLVMVPIRKKDISVRRHENRFEISLSAQYYGSVHASVNALVERYEKKVPRTVIQTSHIPTPDDNFANSGLYR